MVVLPKNLHEVEVCSFVTSFFLAKGKQLIDIPVCMIETDMIGPAVLTKSMPTCVVVKLSFTQANPALSYKLSDLVVLLILDDIPSSMLLIKQIVKVVGIEVCEVVQHERPSIGHGAEHRLHGDLFSNLLEQLIEMIDGVWTIFRERIFHG